MKVNIKTKLKFINVFFFFKYVEFFPDNTSEIFALLMSYNRMPTMKSYDYGVITNGTSREWAERGLTWDSEGGRKTIHYFLKKIEREMKWS